MVQRPQWPGTKPSSVRPFWYQFLFLTPCYVWTRWTSAPTGTSWTCPNVEEVVAFVSSLSGIEIRKSGGDMARKRTNSTRYTNPSKVYFLTEWQTKRDNRANRMGLHPTGKQARYTRGDSIGHHKAHIYTYINDNLNTYTNSWCTGFLERGGKGETVSNVSMNLFRPKALTSVDVSLAFRRDETILSLV